MSTDPNAYLGYIVQVGRHFCNRIWSLSNVILIVHIINLINQNLITMVEQGRIIVLINILTLTLNSYMRSFIRYIIVVRGVIKYVIDEH